LREVAGAVGQHQCTDAEHDQREQQRESVQAQCERDARVGQPGVRFDEVAVVENGWSLEADPGEEGQQHGTADVARIAVEPPHQQWGQRRECEHRADGENESHGEVVRLQGRARRRVVAKDGSDIWSVTGTPTSVTDQDPFAR